MLQSAHITTARYWAQFRQDRNGTVALMFGLIFMGLIAGSAIAIDSSRLNRARAQTSAALDAASLATAKALRVQAVTDAELQQLAHSYFEANLRAQRKLDTTYDNFTVTIDRDRNKADISVDITMPTALGSVFNITAFRETLTSQSVYSARDIELGMMLDVSGSMRGSKIAALRSSAKELVDIVLDDAQGPSKNRIGIAPYSSAVNAGTYAAAATNNASPSYSSCVTERSGAEAFTDAPPSAAPLRKRTTSCSGSTITPLSNEREMIKSRVDALTDGGSTAGHLGIAWAWYLVSPQWASFWPSASAPRTYGDPEVMKAVIIMTDGEFNTQYESANGSSVQQAQRLCENIKSSGVIVFSVGFEAPPAALAVLQQCASQSAYYYDARNASELRDAFNRIARELTGLRLTG